MSDNFNRQQPIKLRCVVIVVSERLGSRARSPPSHVPGAAVSAALDLNSAGDVTDVNMSI